MVPSGITCLVVVHCESDDATKGAVKRMAKVRNIPIGERGGSEGRYR